MTDDSTAEAAAGTTWIGRLDLMLKKLLRTIWNQLHVISMFAAIVYALPSLAYPFGRDQAIFYYVGREWSAGRLPYRDAFDIKPPGIYALYGLTSRLLGERTWSIRLVEILGTLLVAWCAVIAVGGRDRKTVKGEFAAVAMITVGFYYTVFDYWDTGQVEFWEGLAALAGYAVARAYPEWRVAALGSGLLAGVALLFKPPIAVLLPIAGMTVVWRASLSRRPDARYHLPRALGAAGIHGLAAASMIGLVLLYFAAKGGWKALMELVGYTAHYVKNKPTQTAVGKTWFWYFWKTHTKTWVRMIALLWATGVVIAVWKRAWKAVGSAFLALLFVLLAVYSGVSQNKFWSYHWVVVTPFLVLMAAHGVARIAETQPSLHVPIAMLCLFVGHWYSPTWATNSKVTYRSYTREFWSYLRGHDGRYHFLTQFGGPYGYSYVNQEIVGDLIGDRAKPGDQLHVRGFEPAIYAVSRLSSPSRFASEAPLIDPTLQYNRAAWKAEHDTVIWRAHPRFIVSFVGNVDDHHNIVSHGYHPAGEFANFVWFESN